MSHIIQPPSPLDQARIITRDTGDIALVVETKKNGRITQSVIPIAGCVPRHMTIIRVVFPDNHKGGSYAQREKPPPRSTMT